jgi:hypothetical protein
MAVRAYLSAHNAARAAAAAAAAVGRRGSGGRWEGWGGRARKGEGGFSLSRLVINVHIQYARYMIILNVNLSYSIPMRARY